MTTVASPSFNCFFVNAQFVVKVVEICRLSVISFDFLNAFQAFPNSFGKSEFDVMKHSIQSVEHFFGKQYDGKSHRHNPE